MKAEEDVKMKGEMEERVARELEEKIFNIVSTQNTIMYVLGPKDKGVYIFLKNHPFPGLLRVLFTEFGKIMNI